MADEDIAVDPKPFAAHITLMKTSKNPVKLKRAGELDTERDRQRERERQRERKRERETERKRERQRETKRQTDRQTETKRQTDRQTERGSGGGDRAVRRENKRIEIEVKE